MLNTPAHKDLLVQLLYRLAAATRLELKVDQLSPTLIDAKVHDGDRGPEVLELWIRVDLRTPDSLRAAAAHVHHIASRIEAAAGPVGPRPLSEIAPMFDERDAHRDR